MQPCKNSIALSTASHCCEAALQWLGYDGVVHIHVHCHMAIHACSSTSTFATSSVCLANRSKSAGTNRPRLASILLAKWQWTILKKVACCELAT